VKKRDLAEVLTDVRVARNKIRLWHSRIENKIMQYQKLSATNATRYSVLAEQYAKESEQLEKITSYLDKLDILLEMLEIKIETIISVGHIINDAPTVMEALKIFKNITPSISSEFSLMIDNISNSFYSSIEIPQDIKIRATQEAQTILDEAESILNQKNTKIKA
jgi:division protein CdvB (Snf7/Vps24/ESCRT-III family)